MTDIVGRLRKHVRVTPPRVSGVCLIAEAADEIERLRVAVNDARNGAVAASECAGRMMEDRDEAFVEVAQLRAALRRIAHSADYDTIISPDGDRHQQAVEIALEALTEGGR